MGRGFRPRAAHPIKESFEYPTDFIEEKFSAISSVCKAGLLLNQLNIHR